MREVGKTYLYVGKGYKIYSIVVRDNGHSHYTRRIIIFDDSYGTVPRRETVVYEYGSFTKSSSAEWIEDHSGIFIDLDYEDIRGRKGV